MLASTSARANILIQEANALGLDTRQWSEEARHHAKSCGCGLAGALGTLTIVGFLVDVTLNSRISTASILVWIVAFFLVVSVGKATGVLVAEFRLSRLIKRIESALPKGS